MGSHLGQPAKGHFKTPPEQGSSPFEKEAAIICPKVRPPFPVGSCGQPTRGSMVIEQFLGRCPLRSRLSAFVLRHERARGVSRQSTPFPQPGCLRRTNGRDLSRLSKKRSREGEKQTREGVLVERLLFWNGFFEGAGLPRNISRKESAVA